LSGFPILEIVVEFFTNQWPFPDLYHGRGSSSSRKEEEETTSDNFVLAWARVELTRRISISLQHLDRHFIDTIALLFRTL